MKKTKFALASVLISAICFVFALSGGLELLSAGGISAQAQLSMVPAAGDISRLWLGVALIICAVGIIILVLSRRRK